MRAVVLFAGVLCAAGLLAQEPQAPVAPGAKPAKPEPAPVKPEDKCSVEGNIYSLKTGEPLKKADVQMRKVDATNNRQFAATTDIAGTFKIENLDPGRYNLTASRNGYVTTTYGGKGRTSSGTIITLTPGTKMKDVAVKLPVQGVMTGRVIDEDGEPLAGVGISLMRRGFINGKRTLWSQASGQTSDKGEYRVYGIAPGRYYVVANARGQYGMWAPPEVRSEKEEQVSYAPTYYPNGLSESDAALVDILAGGELAGVDFRLVKTRSFKITGKIMETGSSRHGSIQLMPQDSSGGPQWSRMSYSETDEKGNFAFRGVRPGRYIVSADLWSEDTRRSAHTQVIVADSDVAGVQLVFVVNPDLPGSVRVEGSEWSAQETRVGLQPDEDMTRGATAEVKEDGTFKLRNVPSDRMRVSLWPMPDGHYIKSVRSGDQNSDSGLADFTEGVPGELVITLSPKAATVAGTIKDSKDQIVTSASVVLVPDDRKRTDLYSQGGPDQNGTYTIKNVHPGSYKVYAFDAAEWGSYQDPDWLKPFEDKGESIEVKESEKSSKDLKLIVTEEGK